MLTLDDTVAVSAGWYRAVFEHPQSTGSLPAQQVANYDPLVESVETRLVTSSA